jgi:hypothetical protein
MKKRHELYIALFLVVSVFVTVALASPITPSDFNARIGAFTGPEAGTAQDDNAKASLDLAHTDLDTGLQNDEDLLAILGEATGNIFYVDSAVAGSAGTSWATAVGTLDAAVNLCSGDAGDIILIAPGHSEALTAADGVDADVADVKIYGMGTGENRPLFDYTNANGEFVIGADDVEVHNCQFLANVTDVAHAIDVESGAENWLIKDCRFYVNSTGTDEFTDVITTAADSDNGRIINCRAEMGAGGADAFLQNVGCDYVEIFGNIVSGDYATACIEDKTTASIWLIIKDNILFNGTVGGTAGLNAQPCIELKSDTAASITDNKLFCNVASKADAVVAADGFLEGNTYNETEGSDTSLKVGQTYVRSMTSLAIDDDLFDVSGGSILITSFTGVVTTVMQAQANAIEIVLDADDTYDYDFTTAVETNADAAGTRYVFDNTATESVLTPCEGADGGAAGTMVHWLCAEGMIELNAAQGAQTGGVKWFMTFIPLEEGVTVTAQ